MNGGVHKERHNANIKYPVVIKPQLLAASDHDDFPEEVARPARYA